MTIEVGDKVILIPNGRGGYLAQRATAPDVGDKVILIPNGRGGYLATKSVTPSVGDMVKVLTTNRGRCLLSDISTIKFKAVVFYYGTDGYIKMVTLANNGTERTYRNIDTASAKGDCACVLDSNMKIHLATNCGDKVIYRLSSDYGVSWNNTTVDDCVPDGGYGYSTHYLSLALDSNELPGIYYSGKIGADYGAKYAKQSVAGVAFDIENVLVNNLAKYFRHNLDFDSSDYPRCFTPSGYYTGGTYSYKDGSGWNHVNSTDLSWAAISLIIDNSDYTHLVGYYWPYSGGGYMHKWEDGSGWHSELADAALWSLNCQADIDQDGNLVTVGYVRRTYPPTEVWTVGTKTGETWAWEKASDDAVFKNPSFKFDELGYLHIVYESPEGTINYAYKDNLGWHKVSSIASGNQPDIIVFPRTVSIPWG
jgi:hypothetical protein